MRQGQGNQLAHGIPGTQLVTCLHWVKRYWVMAIRVLYAQFGPEK